MFCKLVKVRLLQSTVLIVASLFVVVDSLRTHANLLKDSRRISILTDPDPDVDVFNDQQSAAQVVANDNCVCVFHYLCDRNYNLITTGDGIIDERIGPNEPVEPPQAQCATPGQICCRLTNGTVIPTNLTPVVSPTVAPATTVASPTTAAATTTTAAPTTTARQGNGGNPSITLPPGTVIILPTAAPTPGTIPTVRPSAAPPTTAAPTTAAPTTAAPTTAAPTTAAPTTAAPTTATPTTAAPTTAAPTTAAPTTAAPTTAAPTTAAPTTAAPTTAAPTTAAPPTAAPATTAASGSSTAAPATTAAPTTSRPIVLPTLPPPLSPTPSPMTIPTVRPGTLPPTTMSPTSPSTNPSVVFPTTPPTSAPATLPATSAPPVVFPTTSTPGTTMMPPVVFPTNNPATTVAPPPATTASPVTTAPATTATPATTARPTTPPLGPAGSQCGVRYVQPGQSESLEPYSTSFAEFPWMLAVLDSTAVTVDGTIVRNAFVAGASLITRNIALTGAHRLRNFTQNPSSLIVRAGEWNTVTANEPLPHQDRTVQRIEIHKDFNNRTLFNDIALLKLEEPVVFANNVVPICLPAMNQAFTGPCVATGWGQNAFGPNGQYQRIMRKVSLPLVDRLTCQSQLRANTRLGFGFNLDPSFLCAGGQANLDTCTGDGGGPLVCPISNGTYMQAGIVSWGIGCGMNNVPGVYVDVSVFREWINSANRTLETDIVPRFSPSRK